MPIVKQVEKLFMDQFSKLYYLVLVVTSYCLRKLELSFLSLSFALSRTLLQADHLVFHPCDLKFVGTSQISIA